MKTAAAVKLATKISYADQDFWLCGQELADNSPFGFADPVDYIKFTMNSTWTQLDGWGSVKGSAVNYELLNSQGTVLASGYSLDEYGSFSLDLTELNLVNKATYYIKLSVEDNKFAAGSISLEPSYNF